jgi:phospholipid/cholesterol/gamma-HCH transport system substrate-binding protein
MRLSREFKIGVFAVVVIAVAWWGIQWLGGRNILRRSNIYYVYYDNIAGLQESSRVTMRGVDIGNVSDITLGRDSVKVELNIEHNYVDMIPQNSIAEICASGIMSGVEVAILQGDSEERVASRSVLKGRVKPDMLGALTDKGTALMEGMSQTVESVNRLLAINSENLTSFVSNLERVGLSISSIVEATAGNIDSAMADIEQFTSALAESTDNIERIVANFDAVTADVAERDIVAKLNTTLESLNGVLTTISEGDGMASQLLTDKQLYNSLTEAGDNLGALLEDVRVNPTRYVHFSLFGGAKEGGKR